jgi:hypothetical protein
MEQALPLTHSNLAKYDPSHLIDVTSQATCGLWLEDSYIAMNAILRTNSNQMAAICHVGFRPFYYPIFPGWTASTR